MSRWTIYDKDGNVLHESIEKFDGKGKAVEQDTLEYSGKWMGDCFITVSFKSAYPIDFQIGDYIMYRGEKFTINYDPTVIKKSSRGTYGEGFTYDSVKFNALSNELTDAKFHDWVLSDNKIHYSSLPNFSFYAKNMNDLADRLQACTDKWCKDNGFAKENYWIFYTPGSGGDTNPYDRTIQRAKDISTDSTFIQNVLTRWKQIYGDGGTLVARDDERLDKSISVSNQTVWQGMAMFKSQFGLNFIVRGREVIVGSAGVLSSHIFQYGKDKGLYEVQKQADTDQKVVTRLHAYGSSDNLPTRYYAELDMKVSASVTDVDKEKDYMRLTLDMPFKPSMYTQKLSKYGDNIYAIRLTLDGTEINARVEGGDDKGKVKIYSEYLEASEDPDDNTDKNTYDAFYNSVKAGSKVYITGGVNKDLAPAGSIDYSMNALPNNMAVMNLMLPGFPKYALSDICKSEYDTNTDTTSYYIRKSKDSSEWVLFHSEQGKHVVRFSSDQYDPYIVSQNADVLGYKDDDIFCTEENDDNGLKKVYPSVEEVTEAEAGVSSSNDYINTIVSADVIKDNGVFSSKTGTTIPGFKVTIKNLGFNLQDAIAAAGGDGCKLSMKDGHCGGRDFDVPSVSKNNDGTWTLNCKRSQDSSLDLYYPYSYNASIGGTPNATESYQICSGDHYVLTGIALEDTNYVWAASVKLLRKAIHWLCKNDYSRYTYSPKIDEIYMARQDEEAKASGGKIKSLHDTLKEGDLLWFKDEDLLLDGKVYIDQLVIKENGNNGIPTYDVTLRNEVQVGTIQRIQNKVDSISNDIRNGNVGGGVNTSTVENITTAVGDTRYLRKDQDDETTHKLTMGEAAVKGDATVGGNSTVDGDAAVKGNASVSGHVLTDDIHSYDSDGNTAMTGRGWTLKNVTDESGTYSVLAVDNLVVRKKMEAAELEIHKKTYVGAQMIASDWGHKILRVDPVDYNAQTGEITSIGMTLFTLPVTIDGVKRMVAFVGRQLSDTETRVELLGDGKGILNRELETSANAFKVYFCESDGTASIEDDLVVGTMGQCQEFNVKERVTHNFTNSYYWGVCLAHGVDEDVRIGDKSVPCVWGVFSHTTDLLTLTSEVSGKTFTCYGMEQSSCTFPVAGDDMVGFGCADPWQDADRCNAIITASKDGENSAPSVISYSDIGRKRGGSVIGTLGTSATPPAYLNIGEQYSIPSNKADSRLDFRISKKAGNVFKGDLYFRGEDGTPHVVGATYMLSADKSVVEYGGDLAVKVYKIIDGKAVSLSSDDLSKAGLSVSLYRTATGITTDVTSVYSYLKWSYLTGNSESFSNVVLSLKKGRETLDTMAVYLSAKALPQTEVWRLVAIKELAEINYDIDKDQYSNYAEQGETGDNTLDKVFVKSGNIALQYYILHQKGDGTPELFSSMSGTDVGMTLSVTESGADGSILYEYSSDGGNVGATHLHDSLSFTDSSDDAANVAVVTVILKKDGNVLDRREVRTSLATNGVAEMNKKFLAYVYYGTNGKGGTQYINKHLSDMTGNYNELSKKVDELGTSTQQKIKETADEYSRQLTQETKDREGAVTSLQSNIDMTAGKLSTEISDRKESENGINASVSRIEQKANTIKEDITNGLKSVGFKMDGATWSVSTWGDRFSWYATKDDADSNDTSKAVMYLDSTTNTLNVKGSVTANLFYGKTKEVAFSESMSSYTIDPQKEPATTYFVDNHYRYESNFFILPKASDYDGLEISIFCKRTFIESRMSLDAFKVFVKCANTSDHFYVKKNFANVLKSGASSLNDFQHEVTVEDKGINYTDFIGDSVMIQQNSLVKFKSIGGAWYAIEGIFYGE